jgi:hypothetical protein
MATPPLSDAGKPSVYKFKIDVAFQFNKHPVNMSVSTETPAKRQITLKVKPPVRSLKGFTPQRAIVLINLLTHEGDAPEVAHHIPKILAWYQKQVPEDNSYYQCFVKSFKLTHMFRNIFELTYLGRTDMVNSSTIIDPDDDGNHPLTINTQEYLVAGHVLKELQPISVRTGYMTVTVKDESGAELEPVRHIAKIKAWYKKTVGKPFNITHIHNDIFEISYKYNTDSVELQTVADPDNTGTSPIVINKKKFFVRGLVRYEA